MSKNHKILIAGCYTFLAVNNFINIIIILYLYFIYKSLNLLKEYILNYNIFLQFEEKMDFLTDNYIKYIITIKYYT